VHNLKTPGNTIGEKWIPLFEIFVDDLERDAGTPPKPEKAAERYMELLRVEVKGLSPGPTSPRPLPPVIKVEPHEKTPPEPVAARERTRIVVDLDEPTPEPETTDVSSESARIGPRYEPDTYIDAPVLALDVLYEMAARSHPSDHEARERHVKLARQIAELELNQRRGGTT